MNMERLIVESSDGVTSVTLNRPAVLNAIDALTLKELADVFSATSRDASARVIVIRGSGRSFCSGGDLKAAKALESDPHALLNFARTWQQVYRQIEECPLPVIAAVHGHCLAGGLELALCCDFIVATDDAKIGDHHAKFNLLPGGGASQRLPRAIGKQRAKEMLYTGRTLTGKEAADIGLVLRSCGDQAGLDSYVRELSKELSSKPREMISTLKYSVDRGMNGELVAGLELELQAVMASSLFRERKAGLEEFSERSRPPGGNAASSPQLK